MRNLILSNGYDLATRKKNIRHLAHGIVYKSHTDAVIRLSLLDLDNLVFQSRISHDFTISREHIQIEGKFREFRNVALYDEAGLLWIEPDREPIDDDIFDGLSNLFWVVEIIPECLIVGDEKVVPYIRNLLHLYPVFQGSDIVPEVEFAGRAHARETGHGFSSGNPFQLIDSIDDVRLLCVHIVF